MPPINNCQQLFIFLDANSFKVPKFALISLIFYAIN